MYHMGFSVRSAHDYALGVSVLRDLVEDGREREGWQKSKFAVPVGTEMIKLVFSTADSETTLIIRVRDLYVIGVQNKEATFYLNDSDPGRQIDNQVLLGFGGHYNDLGSFVSLSSLTKERFEAAARAVSRWKRANPPSNRLKNGTGKLIQSPDARHLLALILATSEAARFNDIRTTVANALVGRRDRPLTLEQIDQLRNSWATKSKQKFPVEVAIPVVSDSK